MADPDELLELQQLSLVIHAGNQSLVDSSLVCPISGERIEESNLRFTRYIPVNNTITSQDLDSLTGVLCHYTAGLIPLEGSYVYSLF